MKHALRPPVALEPSADIHHNLRKRLQMLREQRAAALERLKSYDMPEYEIVELTPLEIDTRYQRERSESKVNYLRAHFDPAVCQPLAVSIRAGGERFCIDGQHRAAVLLDIGYAQWPGVLYRGLTPAQEAQMWCKLNTGQSKPRAEARFRAAVTAEDAEATAIEAILAEKGFFVGTSNVSRGRGAGHLRGGFEIRAVDALQRIYRRSRGPGLRHVLDIITWAWPDPDETGRTHRLILMGTHVCLTREWRNAINHKLLAAALGSVTPGVWMSKLRDISDPPAECLALKVRDIYNRKTRRPSERL